MKIFTEWKIGVNATFTFWGDGEEILEVGDIIYIWQDRNRYGLGEEVIYGTAEIVKVLQNNYYEAKRFV